MASHRVLVTVQAKDFSLWERGKLVDYDGPPDWKFEPLDLQERQCWETETARPDQVEVENQRLRMAGFFEEGKNPAPKGMWLEHGKRHLPPSGMPAGWEG